MAVNHLDLYRLEGLEAKDALEVDDYLDPEAITFVEWADPALGLVRGPHHRSHLPPDARDATGERRRARRGASGAVLILALDASTPVVTVAVAREDEGAREVLAEISVSSGGTSEVLLPAVDAALDLAGADLASVERVLAGVGPGTFTGIRIAAATARALALATRRRPLEELHPGRPRSTSDLGRASPTCSALSTPDAGRSSPSGSPRTVP